MQLLLGTCPDRCVALAEQSGGAFEYERLDPRSWSGAHSLLRNMSHSLLKILCLKFMNSWRRKVVTSQIRRLLTVVMSHPKAGLEITISGTDGV